MFSCLICWLWKARTMQAYEAATFYIHKNRAGLWSCHVLHLQEQSRLMKLPRSTFTRTEQAYEAATFYIQKNSAGLWSCNVLHSQEQSRLMKLPRSTFSRTEQAYEAATFYIHIQEDFITLLFPVTIKTEICWVVFSSCKQIYFLYMSRSYPSTFVHNNGLMECFTLNLNKH